MMLTIFIIWFTMTAARGFILYAVVKELNVLILKTNLPGPVKAVLLIMYNAFKTVTVWYDIALNVTLATVVFADSPHGLHTFSWRMGRYLDDGYPVGFRKTAATQVCKLLSMIEIDHCKLAYWAGV